MSKIQFLRRKHMKKVLVMLLCAVMLLSVLAGCANTDGNEQEDTTAATEENNWISSALEPTDEFSGNTLTLLVNREMDAGTDEASTDP